MKSIKKTVLLISIFLIATMPMFAGKLWGNLLRLEEQGLVSLEDAENGVLYVSPELWNMYTYEQKKIFTENVAYEFDDKKFDYSYCYIKDMYSGKVLSKHGPLGVKIYTN